MADPPSDEWTFVHSKKGRKTKNMEVPATYSLQSDNDATVESLQNDFSKYKARWKASISRSTIYETFRRLYLHEQPRITKAVSMGLGNFTTINLDIRKNSMTQLAVFLDIVEHLKELHRFDMSMYAQEPRFTEVDKAFLASFGITILDMGPSSSNQLGPVSEHLDNNTFVADFFVQTEIAQQLLDFKPRLLVSALPGAIEKSRRNELYFDTKHSELLQRYYKWYKLPAREDLSERGLQGLYVCGLLQEEENRKEA